MGLPKVLSLASLKLRPPFLPRAARPLLLVALDRRVLMLEYEAVLTRAEQLNETGSTVAETRRCARCLSVGERTRLFTFSLATATDRPCG